MIVKLLLEHHLEFLSLKGGCRGSSESTLVKMSNCWKSHAAAQFSQGQVHSADSCYQYSKTLIVGGYFNLALLAVKAKIAKNMRPQNTILNSVTQ